jgi:hypothetical protein
MCNEYTTPKKEYKKLQIGVLIFLTCTKCDNQETFLIIDNVDGDEVKRR